MNHPLCIQLMSVLLLLNSKQLQPFCYPCHVTHVFVLLALEQETEMPPMYHTLLEFYC